MVTTSLRRTNSVRRNKSIAEDYQRLSREGFRTDAILKALSGRYYLSENTIYRIVSTDCGVRALQCEVNVALMTKILDRDAEEQKEDRR